MLSGAANASLEHKPLKRLTFDGIDDLYLRPLYGARTVQGCIELEALRREKRAEMFRIVPVSNELTVKDEQCIE
jgi:hypothetical protein